MAAQVGLNFLSAGMQYKAAKAQAAAQKAWQEYSNKMARLSNSMNQNAITVNEILAMEAFADQAVQLKKGGIIGAAKVETAAAAAGVKGRSVNQAMFDVQRGVAQREAQRQQSFKNAKLAFDQQRVQSSMSAEMQQDYTYIPKPQAASYFLSALSSSMGSFGGGGSGGSGGSGVTPYNPMTGSAGASASSFTNGQVIRWN